MASEVVIAKDPHGARMRVAAALRVDGLKLCNGPCGRVLPLDEFHTRKNKSGGLRPQTRCKDCSKTLNREKYAELRQQVIEIYGGECVVCGDDRVQALDLDHVNDDGAVERITSRQDHTWLRFLRDSERREDLQVLCGSCHSIKTRGGDPAVLLRDKD